MGVPQDVKDTAYAVYWDAGESARAVKDEIVHDALLVKHDLEEPLHSLDRSALQEIDERPPALSAIDDSKDPIRASLNHMKELGNEAVELGKEAVVSINHRATELGHEAVDLGREAMEYGKEAVEHGKEAVVIAGQKALVAVKEVAGPLLVHTQEKAIELKDKAVSAMEQVRDANEDVKEHVKDDELRVKHKAEVAVEDTKYKVQGLKNKGQQMGLTAAEKVQEAYLDAQEVMHNMKHNIAEQAKEAVADAKEKAQEAHYQAIATKDHVKDAVVETKDAAMAKSRGVYDTTKDSLSRSWEVAKDKAIEVRRDALDKYESAKGQVDAMAHQAQERAGAVSYQLHDKVFDMKDKAIEAKDAALSRGMHAYESTKDEVKDAYEYGKEVATNWKDNVATKLHEVKRDASERVEDAKDKSAKAWDDGRKMVNEVERKASEPATGTLLQKVEDKATELKDKTIQTASEIKEAASKAYEEKKNEAIVRVVQQRAPTKEAADNALAQLEKANVPRTYVPPITTPPNSYNSSRFVPSRSSSLLFATGGGALGYGAALMATRRATPTVRAVSLVSLTVGGAYLGYRYNYSRQLFQQYSMPPSNK